MPGVISATSEARVGLKTGVKHRFGGRMTADMRRGARGSARRRSSARICVDLGHGPVHIRLGARSLAAIGAAAVILTGWSVYSAVERTMTVVVAQPGGSDLDVLRTAYERRIEELSVERNALAARSEDARLRLDRAIGELKAYQDTVETAVRDSAEDTRAIRVLRLRVASQEREIATLERRAQAARARAEAAQRALEEARVESGDLSRTVVALSDGLADTAGETDALQAEKEVLQSRLAEVESALTLNEERQTRLLTRLEEAVRISSDGLERAFTRVGMDVESVITSMRDDYTGQGGPLLPELPSDDEGAALDLDETALRMNLLMAGIDRLNLIQIAAQQIPIATPVTATHRQTSGFGPRRDPFNNRIRMHNGLDFAAPRGTAVLAPADGVVIKVERQRGFGNLIQIRHAFGYESIYAHLHRFRVKVGDSVRRGDRIGDIGSTGRSTGPHLHYEIHKDGTPVDPLNYLEAARDVL